MPPLRKCVLSHCLILAFLTGLMGSGTSQATVEIADSPAGECASASGQPLNPAAEEQIRTNIPRVFQLAGGWSSGGGGKGVLCDGKLEVLDLWEAEHLYHLRPRPAAPDFMGNLKAFNALTGRYFEDNPRDIRLPNYADQLLANERAWVLDRFEEIPPGSTLPVTRDATLPKIPPGCSFVQIAINTQDDKYYRDPRLWKLLSPMGRAALVMHETIYREARDYGARTSDQIRRLIGLIFAHRPPEAIFKPLWSAPQIAHCLAGGPGTWPHGDFEFRAIDETREGRRGLGIYFETFQTSWPMGRVSAFIPGASLDSLQRRGFRDTTTTVTEKLFGGSWKLELAPDPNPASGMKFRIRAWENKASSSPPPLEAGACYLSYP